MHPLTFSAPHFPSPAATLAHSATCYTSCPNQSTVERCARVMTGLPVRRSESELNLSVLSLLNLKLGTLRVYGDIRAHTEICMYDDKVPRSLSISSSFFAWFLEPGPARAWLAILRRHLKRWCRYTRYRSSMQISNHIPGKCLKCNARPRIEGGSLLPCGETWYGLLTVKQARMKCLGGGMRHRVMGLGPVATLAHDTFRRLSSGLYRMRLCRSYPIIPP